jgi:hypothetical protein
VRNVARLSWSVVLFIVRPHCGSISRSRVSVSVALAGVISLAGLLALSGCSSKKASDTTSAVVAESTAASESVDSTSATIAPSAETLAEALPGSVDSSVASDSLPSDAAASDAAVSDSVASDSAVSDSAAVGGGVTASSVDPQVAMEAAIVSGMSSQLGVTDPKQLACVSDSVKGADFAKPEGQGKILRGVLKCAPDAMAAQGAKSLREANPTVTEKQSVCVVKATFEVLGGMADSELVSAMSSSKLSPAIVEATIGKAKGCGLTEAEIRKAIQQK